MTIPTIRPRDLAELCHQGHGVDLIDVRAPIEFREVHAEGAVNVPLSGLNPAAVMAQRGNSEKPLYVICRSGNRGRQACERFQRAGFAQVVNVEGGTLAWEALGLPVARGKKAISLERQVRIAAGGLVVLGTALGWWLHPGFLALAAFVGAGLMFAGITDTCGMGMLMARMPWNRVREEAIGSDTPSCCARQGSDQTEKGEAVSCN